MGVGYCIKLEHSRKGQAQCPCGAKFVIRRRIWNGPASCQHPLIYRLQLWRLLLFRVMLQSGREARIHVIVASLAVPVGCYGA